MWNLFKTLSERDSARLRRLEKDFNTLADDVEMCVAIIPKINARLRARATRAAAADAVEEEPSTQSQEQPSAIPSPQSNHQVRPQYSKDQLRQFARSRGLIQ